MKMLLKILKIIAIIILVIAAIGFLFPRKIQLEKSIVINAPIEKVFNHTTSMQKFNSWSPWYEMDTTTSYAFEGPDQGVGAVMHWQSNDKNVGKGSMKVVAFEPNKEMRTELNFMEQGVAGSYQLYEPSGEGTKVTWGFETDMGMNPLMRLMGTLMAKSAVGKDYEKGLTKMKSVVENLQPEAWESVKVEEIQLPPMYYMAIRDTAGVNTIGMKLGMHYHSIGEEMKKQKLEMAGAPFAIYYSESSTNFDMDVAIPVNKEAKSSGSITAGKMKGGSCVVAHYFGAYEQTGNGHIAAHQWMMKNGKQPTGAPWESYVTDPMAVKDTAQWQTDVYYPTW